MPEEFGRFVWYDLMTTDAASAADFYREAFGWRTGPWKILPTSASAPSEGRGVS